MNQCISTAYQTLWDIIKTVLRGKFIAISAHVKKLKSHQVKGLAICLKELGGREGGRKQGKQEEKKQDPQSSLIQKSALNGSRT